MHILSLCVAQHVYNTRWPPQAVDRECIYGEPRAPDMAAFQRPRPLTWRHVSTQGP